VDTLQFYLPVLMLLALGLGLFSGYPVALVLVGVGLLFGIAGSCFGLVHAGDFTLIELRIFGLLVENEDIFFPAIPALLLIGVILEQSGIAREMLGAMSRLTQRVPGNLAVAVTLLGLMLAPVAGLVGASVTTLAMIALPTMLDAGYTRSFATGTVAAAGTLGIVLPPAVMLFFMAFIFHVQIPVLFLGILGPIAALLALYVAYQVLTSAARRELRPAPSAEPEPWAPWLTAIGRDLLLPGVLFLAVFAALIFAWATPLECATLGALGSLLIAALHGDFSLRFLARCLKLTAVNTGMIFFVVMGASVFAPIFVLLGGPHLVTGTVLGLGGGSWGTLLVLMGIVFLLGFLIDWLEITFIFFPIFVPIVASLDFSAFVGLPVLVKAWITILFTLNLQSSFMTPPVGFSLFFVQAAAPPETTLPEIYRGVAVYVVFQVLVIGLVLAFPALVTWLPAAWLRSR
jgi:tripartite ATP-independent transporter DctM subunit